MVFKRTKVVSLFSVTMLLGCDPVALAPPKVHTPSQGSIAKGAKQHFWKALHSGAYDEQPEVAEELTAAYVAEPRDAELALLTGHAHLWRLSERSRLEQVSASITDQAVLAVHYFEQASRMRPEDGRIGGWLGGARLALGAINDDERLRRQGYFTLLDAAESYPEFNHFSFGYALSRIPVTHERWPEVVEAMWKSVDACADEEVSRVNPDYSPYASEQAQKKDQGGARRVCWNSWMAPHNFEGFFLHNGDVLVKNGQPELGKVMYANARLTPDYDSWPHKEVLEERIQSAEKRALKFKSEKGADDVMVNSSLACTGCHQR